jgi:hypothetical protein
MARGVGWLAERVGERRDGGMLGRTALRRAGAAGLALVGVAQAWWFVAAGESIREVTTETEVRDAFEYVRARAGTTFLLSPGVREVGARLGLRVPGNAARSGAEADAVVLFARAEGPSPFTIPSNDPFLALAVLGPREVNFAWYSSWTGHDRVLVMSRTKAKQAGVALVE